MAVAPGRRDRQADEDDAQRTRCGGWLIRRSATGLLDMMRLTRLAAAAEPSTPAVSIFKAASTNVARWRRCDLRAPRERPANLARLSAVSDADGQPLPLRRGDEDLAVGFEECFDALECVGDDAGARAGRLENARCGRKAVSGHALTVDVEHRQRRAIEGVVIARVDVTESMTFGGMVLSCHPLPPMRNVDRAAARPA